MKSRNKFDDLKREDMLRLLLEQEDELEKYRPKPARFKLGQLLALDVPKNQSYPGQPAIYFSVLNLEYKNSEWHYGYSQRALGLFNTYPERKLRALSATEVDGSAMPAQPTASGVVLTTAGTTPVQHPDYWTIDGLEVPSSHSY
jgi:hypothetical protein